MNHKLNQLIVFIVLMNYSHSNFEPRGELTMFDTRHLKLIVAVSEEKSVTRAGERL